MNYKFTQRMYEVFNGRQPSFRRDPSEREVFGWDRPRTLSERENRRQVLTRWDRTMAWRLIDSQGLVTAVLIGFLIVTLANHEWVGLAMVGGLLVIKLPVWRRWMNRQAHALDEVTLSTDAFRRVLLHAPDHLHRCLTSEVPMLMKGDWDVLIARHGPVDGLNDFGFSAKPQP